MKIIEITRKEFRIELAPISGNKARASFLKKIRTYFSGNKDVTRIIEDDRYLCNGIEHKIAVRIGTPSEFGYSVCFYPGVLNNIARKNGLSYCADFVPVRLALDFEAVRTRLPSEYSKTSWCVHMSSIEAMTGDMFIIGAGAPNGVFEICPYLSGGSVLSVRWIYGGQYPMVDKDQPILFQCQS